MADWSKEHLARGIHATVDADPSRALKELTQELNKANGDLRRRADLLSHRSYAHFKLGSTQDAVLDATTAASTWIDLNEGHRAAGHLYMRAADYLGVESPEDSSRNSAEIIQYYENALTLWARTDAQGHHQNYQIRVRLKLLQIAKLTADSDLAARQLQYVADLRNRRAGWNEFSQAVEPEIRAFNLGRPLQDKWINHLARRQERLEVTAELPIGLDYVAIEYLTASHDDGAGVLLDEARRQLADDLDAVSSSQGLLAASTIAFSFKDQETVERLLLRYLEREVHSIDLVNEAAEAVHRSVPRSIYSLALAARNELAITKPPIDQATSERVAPPMMTPEGHEQEQMRKPRRTRSRKRKQYPDLPKKLAIMEKLIDTAESLKHFNLTLRYARLGFYLTVFKHGPDSLFVRPQLLRLLNLLEFGGHHSHVSDCAQLILELIPDLKPAERCAVNFSLGIAAFSTGDFPRGKAACIEGLTSLSTLPTVRQRRILHELVKISMENGNRSGAVFLLDVVVDVATTLGMEAEEVGARIRRARIQRHTQESQAIDDLETAHRILLKNDDYLGSSEVTRILGSIHLRRLPMTCLEYVVMAMKYAREAEVRATSAHDQLTAEKCTALVKLQRGILLDSVNRQQRESIGAAFDEGASAVTDFEDVLRYAVGNDDARLEVEVRIRLTFLLFKLDSLSKSYDQFYKVWEIFTTRLNFAFNHKRILRFYSRYLKMVNRSDNKIRISPEQRSSTIDLVVTGLLSHLEVLRREEKWLSGGNRSRLRSLQVSFATFVLATVGGPGDHGYYAAEALEHLSPVFLPGLMSAKWRSHHPALASHLTDLRMLPSGQQLVSGLADESGRYVLDAEEYSVVAASKKPIQRSDLEAESIRKAAFGHIEELVGKDLRELLEIPDIPLENILKGFKKTDCTVLQVVFPDGAIPGGRVWCAWTAPDDEKSIFTEARLSEPALAALDILSSGEDENPAWSRDPWRGWSLINDGIQSPEFRELSAVLLPAALVSYLSACRAATEQAAPRLVIIPDPVVWNIPWPALAAATDEPDDRLTDLAVISQMPALIMAKATTSRARPRRPAVNRDDDTVIAYLGGVAGIEYENEVLNGYFHAYSRFAEAKKFVAELMRPSGRTAKLGVISVHGADAPGLAHRLMLDANTDLTAADLIGAQLPETLVIGACWASRIDSDPETQALGLTTLALTQGSRHVISGSYPLPDSTAASTSSPTAAVLGDLYELLTVHDPAMALHLSRRRHRHEPAHTWAGLTHTTTGP